MKAPKFVWICLDKEYKELSLHESRESAVEEAKYLNGLEGLPVSSIHKYKLIKKKKSS